MATSRFEMKKYCFAPIILILLGLPVLGQSFVAKVNGVYSGDTILVRKDRNETKVRIRGVDCPPTDTDTGRKAKRFIEALLLGRMVHLQGIEQNDDGGVTASVLLENRNVAENLLSAGLAKYRSEAYFDEELADAENLAKVAEIGVWASPAPAAAPAAARAAPAPESTSDKPADPAQPADEILFKKVKYVDRQGDKRKERDAHIVFTDSELVVTTKDGKKEYTRIPYQMVDEMTYERSSHARWETAAAPSIFGSLGDKKKHWLTIIWIGATEDEYTLLRLDKKNYQDIIAACEARVGVDVMWVVEYEPRPF
jgi:endonuclease YncB( thermonuclease family)